MKKHSFVSFEEIVRALSECWALQGEAPHADGWSVTAQVLLWTSKQQ